MSAARFAEVVRQGSHALEVGGVHLVGLRIFFRLDRREAASADYVAASKVDIGSLGAEPAPSLRVVAHLSNRQERRPLAKPLGLQFLSASDVEALARFRARRSRSRP